jgi:solute carrier family 25 protein 33/36
MAFPAPSHDASGQSRLSKGASDSRQTVMVQAGESDDVELSSIQEMKTEAKPWAHFLAGGYVESTQTSNIMPRD